MKNYEGELYHISRVKEFKLGEKLDIGKDRNYFCKRIFDLEFVCNDKDLNELVFTQDYATFSQTEQTKIKEYIYESCLMIRELVLENVRLKDFPDKPSRLHCLYCTKTKEEAEAWIKVLQRMNKINHPIQIVKFKASGNLFEGDGGLMLRNTFSINTKEEMAKTYWSQQTKSQHMECLFEGSLEVTEVEVIK